MSVTSELIYLPPGVAEPVLVRRRGVERRPGEDDRAALGALQSEQETKQQRFPGVHGPQNHVRRSTRDVE